MKINITDEIRQEILDTLNRDTAKEYFEKLRDTEKNPTRGQVYAYRSWEQSTEDRADMFEVRALPWGSQIKDGVMKEFVAALTAAAIDEISGILLCAAAVHFFPGLDLRASHRVGDCNGRHDNEVLPDVPAGILPA